MRKELKQRESDSISPCGVEACVDGMSEGSGDEGDSGVRAPRKVQYPKAPTQAEVALHPLRVADDDEDNNDGAGSTTTSPSPGSSSPRFVI